MIVTYPHSVLTQRAIEVMDARLVIDLIDRMIGEMYAGDGVGLAAPQLGVLSRVIVVDPSAGEDASKLTVLINPMIVYASEEKSVATEGCLSLPGVQVSVERSTSVIVEYDVIGSERTSKSFEGFEARIVQHECDHLEGITLLARAGFLDRRMALKALRRAVKELQ